MKLIEALDQALDYPQGTHCVTNGRYKERREFVEIREGVQTLLLLSWALPTSGTTWCPTLDDLFSDDWDVFYPEQYNQLEVV